MNPLLLAELTAFHRTDVAHVTSALSVRSQAHSQYAQHLCCHRTLSSHEFSKNKVTFEIAYMSRCPAAFKLYYELRNEEKCVLIEKFSDHNYRAFRWASEWGYVNTLKFFFKLVNWLIKPTYSQRLKPETIMRFVWLL